MKTKINSYLLLNHRNGSIILLILSIAVSAFFVNSETLSAANIVSGGIYKIQNQCSDKVADVSGVSSNDGAPIHLWTYLGAANQQFKAVDAGDGNFTLLAQHSGKAMDVQESRTADGTLVWQHTPNGTNAQKWRIVATSDGYYKIAAAVIAGQSSGRLRFRNCRRDADLDLDGQRLVRSEMEL